MWRFFAVAFGIPWLLMPVMYHTGYAQWALLVMFAPAMGALAAGFRERPELQLSAFKHFFYPLLWVGATLAVAPLLGVRPAFGESLRLVLARVLNVPPDELPEEVVELVEVQNLLMPLLVPMALLVNTFVAFGEEYGWRGYLTPALARRLGWAKASVAVGVLWGVWHAPVLLLGHNYFYKFWPPSVLLMAAFCAAASPFFTYVYLRHGVWGAAASHGGVNAFAGLYYLLYPPEPVWLSNPAGLAGTLAWLPLSLYAYSKLRRAAKESSASADVSTPGT
ncbi:MAG: CPBP family intramembrane glutamic endopeptidase [Pyrobaculum sp.]|uniref:CPBP family intramembrane glutamic endopeptidase n=1 Tax=Pyrobaculum sp. TaxID=2004705 RepID=UPI003168A20D